MVALDRRKMETLFYTESSNIKASSMGRFLGFNLSQQACFPAARQMATVGRVVLSKVSCLSGLSMSRKRTIYLALVRSRITYPFSPWASMKPPQIFTLQAVETYEVDFIGNHKWYERVTQKDKHERLRIEPLNLFL